VHGHPPPLLKFLLRNQLFQPETYHFWAIRPQKEKFASILDILQTAVIFWPESFKNETFEPKDYGGRYG
jgi:hypothetical protein